MCTRVDTHEQCQQQQSEQAQVLNYRSPKKEPERRSGRQKRNRNAGPVRSGSTGALKAAPVP